MRDRNDSWWWHASSSEMGGNAAAYERDTGRTAPEIPFRAAVAFELAKSLAWRADIDRWSRHVTVFALNVPYEHLETLEQHGFKRTDRVRFVGGPKRDGARVNMHMFVSRGG